MKRHTSSRDTAFKKHCVADDAFDASNMRRRISLSSNGVAVGVDANRCFGRPVVPAQGFVEQNSGR